LPIIDLPDERPLPGASTLYFPIQAVMLYPRDDERRLHWYAASMVGAYDDWRTQGAPEPVLSDFHGWIGILWHLKQAPKRVWQDGLARAPRAALSGLVLLYLLRLAQHHPGRCSLEHAKALVVGFAPREDDEVVSDSLVDKSWAEFKTVSHLWAAMTILSQDKSFPGTRNKDWVAFLGVAESLRESAESARLLDPRNSWKAPSDRIIPKPEEPPKFTPLSDQLLQFLG
jgi:hypothetical protein